VWNDLPLKIPKPDSFVDLKEIAKWGFEYQMKLDEFLGSPKASDLNRIIEIPWSKFVERKLNKSIAPAMLQETMMQVIMHSTYHRGQINTRLRELGGEPPQVDFILWTWLGKPESNWSTVAL